MVEGEKTLKIIEKLSNSRNIFNRMIRVVSCDVLINCTRPMVKTELKSFLCSIIHKSAFEAMYINLYGRPKLLHMPIITDLQYIKSIVKTIINNVIRKAEYFLISQENNMTSSNYLRNLKHFNLNPIPNIVPNLNTTTIENDVTKLRQFSNMKNSNHGFSRTYRLDNKITEKSKRKITSNASSEMHKIHLPKNHKDYWKYKKIYENITK